MTTRQLVLPFPHEPVYAAQDLIEGPGNADALAWLARTEAWPGARLVLWGDAGTGKTHLAHLWAARQGGDMLCAPRLRGLLIPLGAVAVDDADAPADEEALLHVLNAAAEAGHPVLLVARQPPARWAVRLADLASRVRAATAIEVAGPDDAMLRALLARLAADRQLDVPGAVQDYLLARLPRTPAALREALARLDRAGLAAGRGVTRALAAAVLADMGE